MSKNKILGILSLLSLALICFVDTGSWKFMLVTFFVISAIVFFINFINNAQRSIETTPYIYSNHSRNDAPTPPETNLGEDEDSHASTVPSPASSAVNANGSDRDTLSFCTADNNIRPSIWDFPRGNHVSTIPNDYVVIDVETSGLSISDDVMIELAALRISDGNIVDSFTSLVYPEKNMQRVVLSDFITNLTGITNDMLNDAPPMADVLPQYLAFIGDAVLVGHNVKFDIDFIRTSALELLNARIFNDYLDTLKISRKALQSLQRHRLDDLIQHYNLTPRTTHRALDDCHFTNELLLLLKNDLAAQNATQEERQTTKTYRYDSSYQRMPESYFDYKRVDIKELKPASNDFDKAHPAYKKAFSFTGDLPTLSRLDAMQMVVDAGGAIRKGVGVRTHYLVLGQQDLAVVASDGMSAKERKAKELISQGTPIQIINEDGFLNLMNGN